MTEQKTEELSPETLDDSGRTPKGEEPIENVEMPVVELPDYGYGTHQNTLDATKALRNIPGGKFKGGNGTRTTTGTQAITGIGFKPKSVRITAFVSGANGGVSNGYADNSGYQYSTNGFNNPTSIVWESNPKVVYLNWSSAGASVANLVSFDDDGFTLNWTSIGPSVTFRYECEG